MTHILQDQHVASATSFTGRFNIYDLILDKCYFEKTADPSDGSILPQQMTKEDMTLIKVILADNLNKVEIENYNSNHKKLYSLFITRLIYLQVAFCRVLGTLFCYGYDVVIASDLSRDATAHSTVFFRLRDPRHDYLPLHYYSHKVKKLLKNNITHSLLTTLHFSLMSTQPEQQYHDINYSFKNA